MSVYGLETLRRLRERQQARAGNPSLPGCVLADVPPEAPMDSAVVTVWNGERFIAWQKWLSAAPIDSGGPEQKQAVTPVRASCMTADCGGTMVWLVRDGERWSMFVGGRRAGNRRKDFASPFMEHAIRTVEAWYGAPAAGWRAEEKSDGR